MKLEQIALHLSSTRPNPNKIMKEHILPFLLKNQVKTALDYGCGKFLRDSNLLTQNNIKVDAVDLEEQIKRIEPTTINTSIEILGTNYDAVIINYVIQAMPEINKRKQVLKKVYNALKKGGYFILSVRSTRDLERSGKIPFRDGFIFGKGPYTFARGYSRKEVEDMMNKLNLETIKIYRTSTSYTALGQK